MSESDVETHDRRVSEKRLSRSGIESIRARVFPETKRGLWYIDSRSRSKPHVDRMVEVYNILHWNF